VTRHPSALTMLCCAAVAVAISARPAHAQTQPPPTPDQPPPVITAQSPADDEGALDPLEPDFSIVNLPTTLRLPVKAGDFHLTHRFNLNLECSDAETSCFSDKASGLFGLDSGANIGLEFRWGVMRHLQAIILRTSISQNIQLAAKYDAWHQSGNVPVSIAAMASIEGDHNFGASTPDGVDTRYSPALGVIVSRKVGDRLAVYAEPFWVHNTAAEALPTRDAGFVGLAARVRVASTVNLLGEVSPRIGGLAIRDPQFGFAIEKRVGGHVFALTFTNNPGTTFGQIAQGGNPDTLNLGFNLTRKFF
jgi:Membrane bound beta barrel domain (DUF5777)